MDRIKKIFQKCKSDLNELIQGSVGTQVFSTDFSGKLQQLLDNVNQLEKHLVEKSDVEKSIEHKYYDLANLLPEMVFEIDTSGKLTFLNEHALSTLGFTKVEIKNREIGMNQVILPDDVHRLAKSMKSNLTGKKISGNEYTLVTKAGGRITTQIFNNPIQVNGKIVGLRGIAIDITDRKKAEFELQKREEKYTSIFQNSPLGIGHYDKNGILTDCNLKFARMLGNTKENLMGFDILSRIKDTDLTNAVKDSLSKGSGYFEGVYYSILTNKNTPVRVLFEGIKNEKGEIYGGVVLAEDISERIGTENALKESEEKFRVLVENQGEGIGVTDQSNFFIFANPAAEQIFGVPPGGLQNKSLKDFTSVEEFRKLEMETQNRIEGKRSTYELEIIRPDGEKRNILATVTPRLDEKGKYQSSIGIFMDITERKKIELHLKNTLEFNKRIINNAFTGIIVYDRHFNYLLWNPVMEEISGYRANEVIGKNAFEIFSHYKKEGMDKILHRALEGETIVRESVRYTLPEKNKQGWTREVFSPNYDGRGKIIGVIAIVSEITRLKEFQNSLEEKNKEIAEQNVELIKAINRAKQSDRLKSAFLRTMSHEIRTPLNAIIGFSDLFNMELDKDELNYYTNSIHQNGLQLLNIIDDIFHISQLESGGADVSKENFDLKEFLHEIRRLTREEMKLAGKEHLELKLHLEEGFERIKVNTDQEKLRHVFLNLLKNSVKFTYEGFVEFGYLFRKDGDLMFFVRDSGIGIPEDKHHLIFERFRQIDERFTRKYGGTGLGLYLCVKILEVLSGKIWLESKVGEGTVFYFTIDNIFEEKEQVRKSIQKEKINFDYIFPGTKILIAEDEYSNFFLLQKMLKNAQAEIIHVENGLEAVEILRKNPDVDLVLMDIKMPVVDGYEASRRIRKFNAKVIILAQTAYALAGDQQKALEAGCNGYISKPIQKRDLMEKLKMFLL